MNPTLEQQSIIEIVLKQTTYTYDIAKQLLEDNDYNYIKVIKLYFGISEQNKVESVTSINQHIFKEIRKFMDTVNQNSDKEQNARKNSEEETENSSKLYKINENE
jgi:hypothetical protein